MSGPEGQPGDGFVLGVDLGTSHTVAMLRWPDGRTRPLLFDGQPLLPSAVYLDTTGRLHVGRDALRLGQAEPGRLEPNPKRHIDQRTVLLGGAEVPVADLLAGLLGAVAREVVAATGFLPPAVLTHPAAWGELRREVLVEAITKAGWPRETRLLPEPVAAARYFADVLRRPVPVGSALAVFDFGGGTLDVAVVRNEGPGPDGRPRFVVAASGGVDDLGGLDLDAALVDHLGKSLAGAEPQAWQALTEPVTLAQWRARRQFWEDVRGAKEMLSRGAFAPVPMPGVEHAVQLTRDEFEASAGPLIRRGVSEAGVVIRAAGLTPRELAGLFLVGGSSRVPLVARLLHSELGIAPTVLEQPELPVAEGAIIAVAEAPSGVGRGGGLHPGADAARLMPGVGGSDGQARPQPVAEAGSAGSHESAELAAPQRTSDAGLTAHQGGDRRPDPAASAVGRGSAAEGVGMPAVGPVTADLPATEAGFASADSGTIAVDPPLPTSDSGDAGRPADIPPPRAGLAASLPAGTTQQGKGTALQSGGAGEQGLDASGPAGDVRGGDAVEGRRDASFPAGQGGSARPLSGGAVERRRDSSPLAGSGQGESTAASAGDAVERGRESSQQGGDGGAAAGTREHPVPPPLQAKPPTRDTAHHGRPPRDPVVPVQRSAGEAEVRYAEPVDPWATGEAAAFGQVHGPAEPWLASAQPDSGRGIGDRGAASGGFGKAYKRRVLWLVAAAALVVLGVAATLVVVFWPKYPALDFQPLGAVRRVPAAAKMGSGFVATAVRGDRAYFASVEDQPDGDESLAVVAADLATGKVKWSRAGVALAGRWEQFLVTPDAVVAISAVDSASGKRTMELLDSGTGREISRSEIGGDDNVMFTGDVFLQTDQVNHKLIAFNVHTGQVRWDKPNPASQYGLATTAVIKSTTVADDAGPASTGGVAFAAPADDDTRVVQIGADRSAQVIDAETGKVRLTLAAVADPSDDVIAHNGRLIVSESGTVRRIVAYDLAKAGQPKVLYQATQAGARIEHLTECGPDRVCFVETVDSTSSRVFAVDAAKGGTGWARPLAGVDNLVPVGDSVLAVQESSTSQATLLDAKGKVAWTKPGEVARLDAGNLLVFSKPLSSYANQPSLSGVHLGDPQVELGPLGDQRPATCSWDTRFIACAGESDFEIQKFVG